MDDLSVQVAVRIRPRIPRELIDGCQVCTTVTPGQPQVWMGGNQGFTFDHILDSDVPQENVFGVVRELVDGCLLGYNATIVAYGQTGSGKTYTMGTGFDAENVTFQDIESSHGIIPRAVHHLFNEISQRRQEALNRNESPPEFTIKAQFVELYNEEINDLISSDLKAYRQGQAKSIVKIREDTSGIISMHGIQTKVVNSVVETMTCLRDGALVRSTASTNMNDTSSRSHAIFTLHIYQQRIVQPKDNDDEAGSTNGTEFETLSAKFHFVDLAGSERLKRTGAVGDRAKEGIAINVGLLSLSNVISALGDKSKKVSHVPYRDSKLTRLLQDSLGGNSRTIMIACISPCDRDFVETLNTLKYANRARNIKNKVTINQDQSSMLISRLKRDIVRLEMELQDYQQGKVTVGHDGRLGSDVFQENLFLTKELEKVRTRVKALQESLDRITTANAEMMADKVCDALVSNPEDGRSTETDITQIVRKYTLDIEQLRTKLIESEAMCELLKRKQSSTAALLNQSLSPRPNVPMTSRPGTGSVYAELDSTCYFGIESATDVITKAQAEINDHKSQKMKLKKKMKKRRTEVQRLEEDQGVEVEETNGHAASSGSVSSDVGNTGSEGDFEYEEMDEGGMQEEIANINDQINTKQRLIEQLELSNKRALDTKEQYEQQIQLLVTKIKHTEEERDKVLNNMQPHMPTSTPAKIRQVKDEYETKLSDIQRELAKMKEALKEHNNLVRRNAAVERQVATFKAEVESMKKLKVKLQNQMKDENVKFRETEAKRMKEIHQLKKDQRKKDVQIRALETKDRVKEQILKRKIEEVSALKKQTKPVMSRRAAGKVSTVSIHKRPSPVKGKKKWDELKTAFSKRDSDRKMLEQLESEMLTHILSRKEAKEEIELLQGQIDAGDLEPEEINRLNDEIDSLTASMFYSDEQVSQNQRAICEITSVSTKPLDQLLEISLSMDMFTKEDCEHLMREMYKFVTENMTECKETKMKLSLKEQETISLTRELSVANQLVMYMYSKHCANDPNLSPDLTLKINSVRASNRSRLDPKVSNFTERPTIAEWTRNGVGQSLGSYAEDSEIDPQLGAPRSYPTSPVLTGRRFVRRQIPIGTGGVEERFSGKARRLTSNRKELMGDLILLPGPSTVIEDDGFVRPAPVTGSGPTSLYRSNSSRVPVPPGRQQNKLDRRNTFLINDIVPTTTDSLNNVTTVTNPAKPTVAIGRPKTRAGAASAVTSGPKVNPESQPPMENFNMDTTFLTESNGTISAPGSPGATRKVGNENVFQRLTSSTSGTNVETTVGQGSIRSIRDKASQKSPFIQTHIAEGHAKAVLDVFATEDRLFTSGKDTTVKVWDLNELREITTITGPPTNISRVKYSQAQNLLFCATACYVRVYDLRQSACVRTLSSAGICSPVDPSGEHFLHFPNREQQIAAIAVCDQASSLYTSYGQMVRLWDLRNFSSLGVITGKHESKVMCMETESGRGFNTLVTGSKDHCIKVYTYGSNEPNMNISDPPKATLNPPHYDGIEAFALNGYTLFSGSRDNCIKKWDLSAKPEFALAYNNAHGSWISGLCLPPSHPQYLVSSSRDGTMKVWSTDSTRLIGQVEAHKGGVNCLASNKSCIFTGSNEDGIVAFWKLRNLSSECSGETSPLHGSSEGSN